MAWEVTFSFCDESRTGTIKRQPGRPWRNKTALMSHMPQMHLIGQQNLTYLLSGPLQRRESAEPWVRILMELAESMVILPSRFCSYRLIESQDLPRWFYSPLHKASHSTGTATDTPLLHHQWWFKNRRLKQPQGSIIPKDIGGKLPLIESLLPNKFSGWLSHTLFISDRKED